MQTYDKNGNRLTQSVDGDGDGTPENVTELTYAADGTRLAETETQDSDADGTVDSVFFSTLRSTDAFEFDVAAFSDDWAPEINEIDVSVRGRYTVTLTDEVLKALAAGRANYAFTIIGDRFQSGPTTFTTDEVILDAALFNNQAATQTRDGFVEYEGTDGSVFVSEEVDVFLFV